MYVEALLFFQIWSHILLYNMCMCTCFNKTYIYIIMLIYIDTPPLRKVQHQLEVGSAIQLGNTPQYGTIKEISLVRDEQMAKVEWVSNGFTVLT